MSQNLSADEVKEKHLKVFGPDLGPLYHALENEVTWLHAKWQEYRKLYAKSEQRVNLLNDSAAFFFRVVHEVLWDNILLHIARLTDPPTQGKFENSTLLCLPETVSDRGLADELRRLVQTALGRSQFAREWRNKRLAHQDLALAIDNKVEPLPSVSRQHVEDALDSFRMIMNKLHAFYLEEEVLFESVITRLNADTLIYNLAIAAQAKENRIKRMQQGRSLPEDNESPPHL